MNDAPAEAPNLEGLSSGEAARRRAQSGPNSVEEERLRPLARILRHFWAPVPWMLEATILVQIVLGEHLEAAMILVLLLLNVALGTVQEGKANAALALLKQHLSPKSRVRRDGAWKDLPAAELVPGDVVQVSLGSIVPADLRIAKGSLLLDQSMLTGESVPVETELGQTIYAGGLARRGEAIAEVTATGRSTFFGRAAELVRVAHVESAEQKAVLDVVRNLTILNFVIVGGMAAYAHLIGMTPWQTVPIVLTGLLSAVPVALPATFTLTAALGAKALAAKGVLLTRLSALNEAASIDVLCSDKTGTLTANQLSIAAVRPLQAGYGEKEVLHYAALASSPEGQDPIDAAVRAAAARQSASGPDLPAAHQFVPFDPTTKMAEALAVRDGQEIRVMKGAPAAVASVAPAPPALAQELEALTQAGYRVLAVAAGPEGALETLGLIALSDPPRADSAGMIAELRSLGLRTVMVTGDAAATAATVARAIGLDGPVCPPGKLPDPADRTEYAVYAGVFPEQKYALVQTLQQQGHAVGMCGDGANDAPALKQAQMGIAVSTATDVAKAAAGIVLTEPGLGGIVTCIEEGRSGFQRILTYTLGILVNKCTTLVVMGVGLILTGHAVLTPLLQAMSMLAGDLVSMARAADHARPSPYPNQWRVRNMTLAALPLGLFKLSYCTGVLAAAWFGLGFPPEEMQTLTFVMLALAGQANQMVLRERGHVWHSRPARIMVLASLTDAVVICGLALGGVLMTPLPIWVIGALVGTTALFALGMDVVKVAVRSRIRID